MNRCIANWQKSGQGEGGINDANNEVTVWLIPETLAKTNLSVKKIGDPLNIEVDVLAKYVERLLEKR